MWGQIQGKSWRGERKENLNWSLPIRISNKKEKVLEKEEKGNGPTRPGTLKWAGWGRC